MDITQTKIDQLTDDLSYLEHEAEALKYVIDSVPYDEKPPEGRSVVQTLLFLDHSQQYYYRPVIEDAFKSVRPINLNSYTKPEESFEEDEEKAKDMQKVLYKLAKHRVALLKVVESIPLIDWEREISRGKSSITLYEFVSTMVQKERRILKEIADLIMTYQNSKQMQREIQSRNSSS